MKPNSVIRHILPMVWLFALLASDVFAHPHAFIVDRMTIVFDDQGMAGIRIQWNFDEFFSGMLAEDYDRDHDGRFSPEEVAVLKKEAFDNLAEYGYFSHIKIAGKPFPVKFVKNFEAVLEQGKMAYSFFIPCHVKATDRIKEIRIAQYDTTYYSAILYSESKPIVIENADGFEVTHKLAENPDETYYFEMLHPVEAVIRFRKVS
ncbi:DUF1007 domain-containing protein [Desulfonema ishimotonii]|uniref:DUF1007 domain-containing protein n=1 Tax=Desulfonema ishimotonii TaxID=45657 RepID=A0A401FZR4_9BACT|nr:DUF1007 family protein [Desulfonema ishimotonii]GBC62437.1 DUF1007 domain-containing protein [Desulfonema ishimotonii]